jgi:hypothetical protein
MSDAERAKAYRDRKRGAPPRQPEPCGTLAAVRRHERAGVKPADMDTACRAALREHNRGMMRQWRAKQKAAGT